MVRSALVALAVAALATATASACAAPGTRPTASAPPATSPTARETPTPPPTPIPPPAGWSQSLDFAGDLAGHMGIALPNDPTRRSECTGKNSKTAGRWASTIYGQVGTGSQTAYGVIFSIAGYRGPGIYKEAQATVQVHAVDGSRDWQSRAGDAATLTVANDEESGTVDATLTNLADGKSKLHLTGGWTCRTA